MYSICLAACRIPFQNVSVQDASNRSICHLFFFSFLPGQVLGSFWHPSENPQTSGNPVPAEYHNAIFLEKPALKKQGG
jgi:hypothetical protein